MMYGSGRNPFLRGKGTIAQLYSDGARIHNRHGALLGSRTHGTPVEMKVRKILSEIGLPRPSTILDLGCGRGRLGIELAASFDSPPRLIGVDRSTTMLSAARERAEIVGVQAIHVCGDFHRIPVSSYLTDCCLAAFCLYHAEDPAVVLNDVRRCLRNHGVAILVTKGLTSYRTIDELIDRTFGTSVKVSSESLYETFHSENAAELARSVFNEVMVWEEMHRFRFTSARTLMQYVATDPRFDFSKCDEEYMHGRLEQEFGGHGIVTESLVTYVAVRR